MRKPLILCVLLALAVGCGGTGTVAPPPPPPPASGEYFPGASWRRAAPLDVGLDAARVSALVQKLRTNQIADIHSLLIVRHGYLAVEEYFNGYSATEYHTLQSVTKSVASLMVGIAVDKGAIGSLSRKVTSWFPEYPALQNDDGRKQAMTLADMLTMRSGFEWNEDTYATSPIKQLNESGADWLKFMLDWPMRDQPGSRFQYNSGSIVLLGGLLRNALGGQAPDEFARINLFAPLGMSTAYWYRGNPDSLAHLGGGLYLLPQDLTRIGYLVLHGGQWGNRQIVSSAWLQASLRPSVVRPVTFAGYPVDYGYLWWLFPLDGSGPTGTPDQTIYTAAGLLGQFLFVIPKHDIVMVVTGGNQDYNVPVHFLFEEILPAIH